MDTVNRLQNVGGLLTIALMLLVFSAPAQAWRSAMSDQGQTTSGSTACSQQDCAQGFITGPNLEYCLSAITLDMQRAPSRGITISYTDSMKIKVLAHALCPVQPVKSTPLTCRSRLA